MVLDLKLKFIEIMRTPNNSIVNLHGGVLGASALISAWPYDVPDWMVSVISSVSERLILIFLLFSLNFSVIT